ncbi:MAG: M56 family metallopeptidase [Roseburia sp.]|nr:M56 family metallopeptidase [Roseburia sp.]MCM1279942.1 M56 family metallopeptidase [Robinsoniella sp.]
MSLLQMSISGGIMILTVAVIRVVCLNRLPKKTFPILWKLVLVRLLIPYSIPAPFSIYSFLSWASLHYELSQNTLAKNVLSAVSVHGIEMTEPAAVSDYAMEIAVPAAVPIWKQIGTSPLWGIWMAGAILCAAFFSFFYIRCIREFRTALPVEHKSVAQWIKEHPIIRSISIRQLNGIMSPLTYGILHPVILMPKTTDWDDAKQWKYVLEHEFVHIRRWDGLTKLILIGALCIHWFNPLVWLLFFLLNRDMELACDETVVQHFGVETKTAYALSLIRMEETRSGLAPLCNNFSKHAIEERIESIMKIKKATVFASIAAIMLIVGIAAVFATSKSISHEGEATDTLKAEKADPDTEAFISEEENQEQLLKEYKKFGIAMKNGNMYYEDKPIRYFLDGYEFEDGGVVSRYQYYNENGSIDVHTVYPNAQNEDGSTTLFGNIVNIQPYSNEEFQSRVFFNEPSLEEVVTADATENTFEKETAANGKKTGNEEAILMEESLETETTNDVALADGEYTGGTTFHEIFASYEKYGITYEERIIHRP